MGSVRDDDQDFGMGDGSEDIITRIETGEEGQFGEGGRAVSSVLLLPRLKCLWDTQAKSLGLEPGWSLGAICVHRLWSKTVREPLWPDIWISSASLSSVRSEVS